MKDSCRERAAELFLAVGIVLGKSKIVRDGRMVLRNTNGPVGVSLVAMPAQAK